MDRSENIPRPEVEDEAIVQPLRFMPEMHVPRLKDFQVKQVTIGEITARNKKILLSMKLFVKKWELL
jgi:hypothetical protein